MTRCERTEVVRERSSIASWSERTHLERRGRASLRGWERVGPAALQGHIKRISSTIHADHRPSSSRTRPRSLAALWRTLRRERRTVPAPLEQCERGKYDQDSTVPAQLRIQDHRQHTRLRPRSLATRNTSPLQAAQAARSHGGLIHISLVSPLGRCSRDPMAAESAAASASLVRPNHPGTKNFIPMALTTCPISAGIHHGSAAAVITHHASQQSYEARARPAPVRDFVPTGSFAADPSACNGQRWAAG